MVKIETHWVESTIGRVLRRVLKKSLANFFCAGAILACSLAAVPCCAVHQPMTDKAAAGKSPATGIAVEAPGPTTTLEAAAPPPPPPPEKAWAHSFATPFSPPWKAGPSNPSQTIVVPILGEKAPSVMEVALGCSIMSWNAAGTMRFTVDVSGYPVLETGSLTSGVLERTLTPKRHSLASDVILSMEIPVPQGVAPLGVRVTRDMAKDTLNQDPAVKVLRVSY